MRRWLLSKAENHFSCFNCARCHRISWNRNSSHSAIDSLSLCLSVFLRNIETIPCKSRVIKSSGIRIIDLSHKLSFMKWRHSSSQHLSVSLSPCLWPRWCTRSTAFTCSPPTSTCCVKMRRRVNERGMTSEVWKCHHHLIYIVRFPRHFPLTFSPPPPRRVCVSPSPCCVCTNEIRTESFSFAQSVFRRTHIWEQRA